MIPLFKVAMSPTVSLVLNPVLQSGFIGQGPQVEEFEQQLSVALQIPRPPLTMNSCTSALDMALHLAGIGPGDLVLSTPITCLATNTVIHNRGASIAWVDVDPCTGNMSSEDLATCLELYPESKAVMVVDWAGRIAATPDICRLAYKAKIPVIEDAAHAFAASHNGIPGALSGADYVAWSFQAIKHLTTADGGALACPKEQRNRARLLRWYGLDRTSGTAMRCTQTLKEIGYKYQMNDIAVTIGIANLPLALANVNKHRANAGYLTECIINPVIRTPPWDAGCSYWIYTVLVGLGRRNEFLAYCKDQGIEANLVHARNDFQPNLRVTNGHLLNGVNQFAAEEACIPCGWWLSEKELEHIVEVVNAF